MASAVPSISKVSSLSSTGNVSMSYHKTNPCPKNCQRHLRECPPDCGSHTRWCPDRCGGGRVEVDVKSAAGRRGIVLPDQLFTLIMEHR